MILLKDSALRLFDKSIVLESTSLTSSRSFFYTTPLGRIVNRFSKDVDVLDNFLSESIRMYLFTLVQVTSIFILIVVYFPEVSIIFSLRQVQLRNDNIYADVSSSSPPLYHYAASTTS